MADNQIRTWYGYSKKLSERVRNFGTERQIMFHKTLVYPYINRAPYANRPPTGRMWSGVMFHFVKRTERKSRICRKSMGKSWRVRPCVCLSVCPGPIIIKDSTNFYNLIFCLMLKRFKNTFKLQNYSNWSQLKILKPISLQNSSKKGVISTYLFYSSNVLYSSNALVISTYLFYSSNALVPSTFLFYSSNALVISTYLFYSSNALVISTYLFYISTLFHYSAKTIQKYFLTAKLLKLKPA